MANEVTITVSLTYITGAIREIFSKTNLQFDAPSTAYTRFTQTIGTSEEAIQLGDVVSPGWMVIYNLDDTNFIKVRPASGAADLIEVPAGGVALFKCFANAPFAIADTADVQIEVLMVTGAPSSSPSSSVSSSPSSSPSSSVSSSPSSSVSSSPSSSPSAT